MNRLLLPLLLVVSGLLQSAVVAAEDDELTILENCQYAEDEWNDGDSFVVDLDNGTQLIVRLYGVDCIETSADDETLARRLRSQVRHFGLEGPAQAVAWADFATARSAELLDEPFSVETFYADAAGRGRNQRFYAYVTLADGRDLGTVLVEEGLAVALGTVRGRPDGLDQEEYREILADAEDAAQLDRAGAWSGADGLRLRTGRELERRDNRELREVQHAVNPPPSFPLDLNEASPSDLCWLQGIGEVMAQRIIDERPFETVDGLLQVEGLGPITLEHIRDQVTVSE